jgi:hypothetical protein
MRRSSPPETLPPQLAPKGRSEEPFRVTWYTIFGIFEREPGPKLKVLPLQVET